MVYSSICVNICVLNRYITATNETKLIRNFLTILLLLASAATFGQSTKIFTSDIDNFWIAYDSVRTTTDSLKQIEFIQKLYLDKATDGLKDFIKVRQHSAAKHLRNILSKPKFWTSVRPHTLEIKSHTQEIENLMQRFRVLYPKFKQPNVYFTIGVLNSGGTTSPDKILIGSEIACSDSTVDASELGPWLQGIFKDNQNIVYMVSHELGHTQQKAGSPGKETLLGDCLKEGACDLISELLLQKPVVSPYMTYGKANEETVWADFQKEMLGQERKNWLYNGANAPNGHADLGYFVGYVICKSYYDKQEDKQKALKEIIEMNYGEKKVVEFLEKSGYNGRQHQIIGK